MNMNNKNNKSSNKYLKWFQFGKQRTREREFIEQAIINTR